MDDKETLNTLKKELAALPPMPDPVPGNQKKGLFSRLFGSKQQPIKPALPPAVQPSQKNGPDFKENDFDSFIENIKNQGMDPISNLPPADFIEGIPDPLPMRMQDDITKLEILLDDKPKAQDKQDSPPIPEVRPIAAPEIKQVFIPPAIDLKESESDKPYVSMDDTIKQQKITAAPRTEEARPVKNWKELKVREKKIIQKEKLLDRKISEFSKREERLTQKIARLEKDRELLEKREEEVVELVQRLETDKQTLADRIAALQKIEDSIKAKKEAADKADREHAARDLELKDELRKIKDEQENISKQRAALKKEASDLDLKRKETDTKIEKVNSIGAREKDLEAKEARLSEREQKIKERESEIQAALERAKKMQATEADIARMEETYQRVKERLREEFKKLEEKQKAAAQPEIRKPTPVQPPAQEDTQTAEQIEAMVREAQEHIRTKRYKEAQDMVHKILDIYMKLPDITPGKKKVYYSILSLRNDVKLAEVS